MPITSIASSSSVTRITPSCAVIEEPERPATRIAADEARAVGAGLVTPAPREVFGVPELTDPMQGSGLLEWDYGFTENDEPIPAGLGDANPHNRLSWDDAAVEQAAAFLRDGSLASACDGVCAPE